jgi:hypothetical protein
LSQLQPDGHAGAVAADRHRDRAEAEIVDPSRIADDAAIDPEVAVGVRDVRHQRQRQAQRGRRNDVDGVEPRRYRLRENVEPGNTGQVLPRASAFRVAHSRCDQWVEDPWSSSATAFPSAGIRGGISLGRAPDLRGYGRSDRPEEMEKYTVLHNVGDVVGLLYALGVEQAVIAGHDERAHVGGQLTRGARGYKINWGTTPRADPTKGIGPNSARTGIYV